MFIIHVLLITYRLNVSIFPHLSSVCTHLKAYCSNGSIDLVEVIAYFCPKMALSSKITSISLKLEVS